MYFAGMLKKRSQLSAFIVLMCASHVSAACCIIHVSVWEKPINCPIILQQARRGCAQTELQLQREACSRRWLGHQMSPASSRRGKNSA